MQKKTRCAAYVRCSTNHQDTELQVKDLTEYAERRGWQVTLFEDKGVSGSKDKRPALDEMMAAARKKQFDVVLVWRFDRFGRSLSHLVNSLNEFDNLSIDFVSYSESIDTSTSTGKLVFSIIASIAEFERSLIVERVRAGVAKAKSKGVAFGRKRVPFDYSRALRMRREDGASYRQIGDALGVSYVTVYRALQGA